MYRPSGDQSKGKFVPGQMTSASPSPLAALTVSPPLPLNAILPPSGDQTGKTF